MPIAIIDGSRRKGGNIHRPERHIGIDDAQRSRIDGYRIVARHILAVFTAAHHLDRHNPVLDLSIIGRHNLAR